MEMTKWSYRSDNQTLRSEMTVTTAVMIMDIWTWSYNQTIPVTTMMTTRKWKIKMIFQRHQLQILIPNNELLNAKRNITSKKETEDRKRKSSRLAAKRKAAKKKKKEDRKRKSSRLAAKSKATENKEKEDRKRKSQTSPAKSNKKLKQEEMSDDGDILYKLPKQILQENQKSKVMSETDQLQPIMQAIYKRNPVP